MYCLLKGNGVFKNSDFNGILILFNRILVIFFGEILFYILLSKLKFLV